MQGKKKEALSSEGPRLQGFPQIPEGQLFIIDNEQDRTAHERISELLDDILAAAPRRRVPGPPKVRRQATSTVLSS